jgi:transposase
MMSALKAVLDAEPFLYQDEIRDFFLDAFDIEVHRSTVSRALSWIKMTRKKLRVEAAQRNEELRVQWQFFLQEFTAVQLVFLDESGSDDRTGDRQYGWAFSGVRAVVQRWLARRARVSVLAAYGLEGYIKTTTFEGTCNGDIVEQFILELLPTCNPYPGPRSVIIMDNASVHHAQIEGIKKACRAYGVWIRFLPPYSPDFNPIEESFADLKAYIRRYHRSIRSRFTTYQDFFEWAIRKSGTGDDAARRARGHFRHAGVSGVPVDV